MISYDAVLAAAERLPFVDQKRLAETLLDAFAEHNSPAVSSEWLAVIERRTAELKRDAATAVPLDAVVARMEARIANLPSDAQG